MSQQNINTGTPNGQNGDFVRDAFNKTEANFTELYGLTGKKIKVLNFGPIVSNNGVYSVATAINNIPESLNNTVDLDEIVLFKGIITTADKITFNAVYVVKGEKPGSYGVNGNIVVADSQIERIEWDRISDEPDLTTDPNAYIEDLGEIPGGDFVSTINSGGPYVIDAETNWYFKYTVSGKVWLYGTTLADGTYGTGQTQTTITDYFLVWAETESGGSNGFLGKWDAGLNNPTLDNTDEGVIPGSYYTVSTNGTVDFGLGAIEFKAGDRVEWYGTEWYKAVDNNPELAGNTSDLTNDGSDSTSTYVENDEIVTLATAGLSVRNALDVEQFVADEKVLFEGVGFDIPNKKITHVPLEAFTIFIDTVNGNDTTGTVGSSDFPFQTDTAAYAALPADDGTEWTFQYIDTGFITRTMNEVFPARRIKLVCLTSGGTFDFSAVTGSNTAATGLTIEAPFSNFIFEQAVTSSFGVLNGIPININVNNITYNAPADTVGFLRGRNLSATHTNHIKCKKLTIGDITDTSPANGLPDNDIAAAFVGFDGILEVTDEIEYASVSHLVGNGGDDISLIFNKLNKVHDPDVSLFAGNGTSGTLEIKEIIGNSTGNLVLQENYARKVRYNFDTLTNTAGVTIAAGKGTNAGCEMTFTGKLDSSTTLDLNSTGDINLMDVIFDNFEGRIASNQNLTYINFTGFNSVIYTAGALCNSTEVLSFTVKGIVTILQDTPGDIFDSILVGTPLDIDIYGALKINDTSTLGTNVTTTNHTDFVNEFVGGTGDVANDTIFDAKGDLVGGTGSNTSARLAVGANGLTLTADSTEATGMKWASPPGGGDMLEATYDPNTVQGDAFSMDNMVEGATTKILTGLERLDISNNVSKLAGIDANANNYVHPANHAPSIITQDASNRFVTDTEKSTWNGKQDALIADTDYLTPATAASTYAPVLGVDDNYVTDAEKVIIGNTSGTNTGDQDISGIATNASAISNLDTDKAEITATNTFTAPQNFTANASFGETGTFGNIQISATGLGNFYEIRGTLTGYEFYDYDGATLLAGIPNDGIATAKDLVTKEYADANYASGSGGTTLSKSSTISSSRDNLVTDADGLNDCTSATDVTISIDTFANVAVPVGSTLLYRQGNSGAVILVNKASGVEYGRTYYVDQTIVLWHESTDNWIVLNPTQSTQYDGYALSGTDSVPSNGTKIMYDRVIGTKIYKDIRISLKTADTSGIVTVDVLKNGASVLTTPISIDSGELTSVTALTPFVFSGTTGTAIFENNNEISFDVSNVTDATGLIIKMIE